MPLDPKYLRCRAGQHRPTDVDVVNVDQYTTSLVAVCEVCGAHLEIDVENVDWSATHDAADCCPHCEEGRPWCQCPPEEEDDV